MPDTHWSHQGRAFDEMCMDVARRTGRAGALTVASRNIQTDSSWTGTFGRNISLNWSLRCRNSTGESAWVGVSERSEKIVFDWSSFRLGFCLNLSNGFSFGLLANHRWLFVQSTCCTRGAWAVRGNRARRRIDRSEGGASSGLSVYRRHDRRLFLLLRRCLCLNRLWLRGFCLNRFLWCGAHDGTCRGSVHGAIGEPGAFSNGLLVLLHRCVGGILHVLLYFPGCWRRIVEGGLRSGGRGVRTRSSVANLGRGEPTNARVRSWRRGNGASRAHGP